MPVLLLVSLWPPLRYRAEADLRHPRPDTLSATAAYTIAEDCPGPFVPTDR